MLRLLQMMNEQAIKELQRMFPDIDHLQAETIFKMHEQGKLSKFLENPPKYEDPPDTLVLQTVHVE